MTGPCVIPATPELPYLHDPQIHNNLVPSKNSVPPISWHVDNSLHRKDAVKVTIVYAEHGQLLLDDKDAVAKAGFQ